MANRFTNIDPELKTAGIISVILNRPSLWVFKLVNWAVNRRDGTPPKEHGYEQRWIDRREGEGKIRLCLYRPKDMGADEKLPILVYLHGGGYAVGSPEMSEKGILSFIDKRRCIVAAPGYRKSLEAPYPAAIDDCYDALLWVQDNAEELGSSKDQIIVGGHSAGGGLTAAVTLRARDRGDVKIAFQMPIYPMIDDRMQSASAVENRAPIWSSKHNKLAWGLYLKGLMEANAPIPYDAAPARATDYAGLPPTITFVGDQEPFYDETRAYVTNLRAAGVPVKFAEYKGAYHGFETIVPGAKISGEATEFLLDAFAEGIDGKFDQWNES